MSLWLLAPVLPLDWTWHTTQGTLCQSCTYGTVNEADDCCPEEKTFLADQAALSGSIGSTDCSQCCKVSASHAPTSVVFAPQALAVLVTAPQLGKPVARERHLRFQPDTTRLASLPRPPPRGRAPPLQSFISHL